MGCGAEARAVAFEADVVCVASEVLEVSDSDGATEASAAALRHRATYLISARFLEPWIGRASIAAKLGNVRFLQHKIGRASIAVPVVLAIRPKVWRRCQRRRMAVPLKCCGRNAGGHSISEAL